MPNRGPSPAAFPIGSPASRAAARAMLQQRTYLSQEDSDCLLLCELMRSYRTAGHQEFQESAIYRRGQELAQRFEEPSRGESPLTPASMCFKLCFWREPVAGDVLTRNDVERVIPLIQEVQFEEYAEAWDRRMWNLPFVLKFEDGKVYVLEENYRVSEPGSQKNVKYTEWHEETLNPFLRTPERWWREVLKDAGADQSVRAVMFDGIKNGKHQCRPATADEQETSL